jgi:hypothetical protein
MCLRLFSSRLDQNLTPIAVRETCMDLPRKVAFQTMLVFHRDPSIPPLSRRWHLRQQFFRQGRRRPYYSIPQGRSPLPELASWQSKNSGYNLSRFWILVEKYTARQLTYPEDILEAFTALSLRAYRLKSGFQAFRHTLLQLAI